MVSLHVPLGITIACLVMIFCFRFPTLRFSLGHGYEAKAELNGTGNTCTAAIRFSPEGIHDCMDEINQLSEVPTSKPALILKLIGLCMHLSKRDLKHEMCRVHGDRQVHLSSTEHEQTVSWFCRSA